MIKINQKLVTIVMVLFATISCSVNNSVDLHFQYEDFSDTIFYKIDSDRIVSCALNISIPVATTKKSRFQR